MRKKCYIVIFLVVLLVSLATSPALALSGFPDANGHWAESEIAYLESLGLVSGYQDGTFGVNNSITRAEVATVITNQMGLSPQAANFPDVSASHWANGNIGAVVAASIMEGYPDGTFKPDQPMTRAEVAKVLTIAHQLSSSATTPTFSDVGSSHWSFIYVEALAKNYITIGYPDGTFKPNNTMIRAEFAVFMARALNAQFVQPLLLTSMAQDIAQILKDEDLAAFQAYVHPTMGVRFSPYNYVESSHLVFAHAAIPNLLSDPTVYNWGTEDGTGDPINKTAQDYFDRYVNNKDYTNPDDTQYNNIVFRGSMINNIPVFYPNAVFVEFYVDGTVTYSGMDWGSLYIIFEEDNGTWYVVAIVHGEWTT